MAKLTKEQIKKMHANARKIGVGGGASLAKTAVRRAVANPRVAELTRHANSLYKTGIRRASNSARKGFMKASNTARNLARKYK